MSQWKIGDVVQLKSGGPRMTVTNTDTAFADHVECTWFPKGSQAERVSKDFFHASTLERYSADVLEL